VSRLDLVVRLLEAGNTLALATADSSGAPHVAPLFYIAAGGLRLYWFSSRSSRHSRNLKASPAAAVTVFCPTAEWKDIRGVQMRGEAGTVGDRALRRSIAQAYVERFRLGPAFEAVMAKSGLYVFQPSWVRYIDNSRGFGYKFELRV
jgi:uncharacterized protein